MTKFTRGAAGLAVAVATAVVISTVPGAEAAPERSAPTGQQALTHAATASTAHTAGAHQLASAAAKQGSLTSRVHGTFNHGRGTVRGTFVPDRFFVKNGQPFAHGVLHATLRKADGSLRGKATKTVSMPIKNTGAGRSPADAKAVCQVLNLVLGPLHLNLLGLVVDLNRVILNITAVQGAGNLLGNLLCGVAGLLDGTGLLNFLKLINGLNRILNLLRM